MRTVEHAGRLLAKHITRGDWAEGLSFFSDDADFIQMGTWRYSAGKQLQRHVHLPSLRTAAYTQEVVVVIAGSLRAGVYAEDGTEVAALTVKSGEALILLSGGHGYEILEDGTNVIEIKNGPYAGAERDRRRY